MATLHRHLQLQDAEHDRLEFRADCPHCQVRLAGRYPASRLLSHRAEATLATGAVLAGALLPAAGAAANFHGEITTRSTPAAVVVDSGDQSVGDHARTNRSKPFNGDGQTDPGGNASGSVAADAAQAPNVQVDVPASPSSPQDPTRAPAPHRASPPREPPTHSAPPSSAPSAAQTPTPRAAGSSTSGSTAAAPSATPDASGGTRAARQHGSASALAPRGAAQRGGAGRGSPKTGRGAASSVQASSSLVTVSSHHVVRAGECLWTIAEHMLGDHASDARIAAAVERLWQLNAGRIGTGSPDLIYPGQRLTMPLAP